MYGYLKPHSVDTDPAVRIRYRQYYCALCHALWNHYGQLSRLMVSFDMAFAAVVLSPHLSSPVKNPGCLKKRALPEPDEGWKKLAALTVLLAVCKLEDDVRDDRSLPARLGRFLMRGKIRKVREDYPDAYRAVKEEMSRFNRLESEGRDAEVMADSFSDVITRGIRALFPDISRKEEAVMRYVTGWIYVADAVDDLDEDRRRHKPNPFLGMASSREELLARHEAWIRRFADERAGRLRSVLRGEDFISPEDWIIAEVINGTIPETTCRVFSLIPGYPRENARPPRKRGGVLYG